MNSAHTATTANSGEYAGEVLQSIKTADLYSLVNCREEFSLQAECLLRG